PDRGERAARGGELGDDARVGGDASRELRQVGDAAELVVGRYQAAVPCELHVPQGAVGAVELVDDAGELACVGKVLAQRQARTAVRGPPPRRHRPPCGLRITQA